MKLQHPYFNQGTGGEGGGGNPDPAIVEAETKEYQELLAKKEEELDDASKAKLAALKEKYTTVEVGPDGNPITPEQKAKIVEIQTKVEALLKKPEAELTADEKKFLDEHTEPNEVDVYAQVDEINGTTVEVDYEAAGVKPNSPEGIALREATIREQAAVEYEELLKAKAPKAYEFMMHVLQGGKEEDFFTKENEDFTKITLKKDDAVAHERIYRKALSLKGNSPDEVDALVQTAKDSGKLFDKAKVELEALQESQQERAAQEERNNKALAKKREEDMNKMADLIETKVTKGFAGINVPVADRKKFQEYLGSSVLYDGKGNFRMVKEVKPDQIEAFLKAEYFAFKNGDLTGVAERTAKSLLTRKLKNSLTIKVVPKTAGDGRRKVTLSEV